MTEFNDSPYYNDIREGGSKVWPTLSLFYHMEMFFSLSDNYLNRKIVFNFCGTIRIKIDRLGLRAGLSGNRGD